MSSSLPVLVGQVIWPALRCGSGGKSLAALRPLFEEYPPGGVIVFGEGQPELARFLDTLRRMLPGEVLVSSDLERGAGQQVREGTVLPPAMALAACASEDASREAGRLTGLEARAAGIDLVFAPVADVNTAATNPIIATRSFGDDPHLVARHACAFARGLVDGGALAVAKHFPGHGSTVQDSHSELARVTHDEQQLQGIDLLPFRLLIADRIDGLMVGHLEVPALDPVPGRPASASPAVVAGLLRGQLRYDGLVISDALDMGGFRQQPTDAAQVLAAGVDVALMPPDPLASARTLERAVRSGELDRSCLETAAERVGRARATLGRRRPGAGAPDPTLGQRLLASSLTRGELAPRRLLPAQPIDLQVFGTDEGGFVLTAFREALRAAGLSLAPDGLPLGLVLTSVAAWAGSSRLPDRDRARLHWAVEAGRLAQVVIMGSPYELLELPGGCPALLAYAANPAAAFALVEVLVGRADAPGRLPVGQAS